MKYRIGLPLAILVSLGSLAHAQTRTPNPDAPAVLRTWPVTGNWLTVLSRSRQQSLVCSMISGKTNSGQIDYLATLSRWPTEWHLGLADLNEVSGNTITLLVDGVRVGAYQITKRKDDHGPLQAAGAVISNGEAMRVMNLFRTGQSNI